MQLDTIQFSGGKLNELRLSVARGQRVVECIELTTDSEIKHIYVLQGRTFVHSETRILTAIESHLENV